MSLAGLKEDVRPLEGNVELGESRVLKRVLEIDLEFWKKRL